MKPVYLVFFEGISATSKLIRKITASRFSHVAYGYYNSLNELKLIECWAAENISIKDFLSFHPIEKFNKKFCWKYSSLSNHTPNTPYVILKRDVSNEVYKAINILFNFIASYQFPYDILGLLGRLSPKFDGKYKFYCSEGVQDVLIQVSKQYDIVLTDINWPGYETDPGKLYDKLLNYGWVVHKVGKTQPGQPGGV